MQDFADAFDVSDSAVASSQSALDAMLEHASELVKTEEQIADIEGLLKRLSARANALKTSIIPDKMAELGMSEFAMEDGTKLKVEDFVSGSLPKDPEKRDGAIKQIEAWGCEGIIRNEVLVLFEKHQHNAAMAAVDDLRKAGFAVEVKSGVHPQTYLALLREMLASGAEVDTEKMGIFVGRKTKVVLPRKAKK